jgi:hypothetical protein
MTDLELDSLD